MSTIIPQKTCSKCGKSLPATTEYFHADKSKPDGFYSSCKTCKLKHESEARQRNPELFRTRDRKRWLTRKDSHNLQRRVKNTSKEHRAQSRAYRVENLEKVREWDRQRYQRDYEKRRGNNERYRKANPAVFVAISQRRLARQRGLPRNFQKQDWLRALEYFKYCCAVCGRPRGLWHTLAADHWIPLILPNCPGTVPTNIVPLCHGIGGCNNRKNSTEPQEWLTRMYGSKKASAILRRIEAYFEWLREQAQ